MTLADSYRGELYRRKDGRWAWRVRAGNGRIVAADGQQGYERRLDAVNMFEALFPMIPLGRA
jgi:uncharacterized protein YegP (UPF0339 family)